MFASCINSEVKEDAEETHYVTLSRLGLVSAILRAATFLPPLASFA
jgi:hypothetical protein